MNRKFKTLAGGAAVAGLVFAGAVAASAVDPVKVEKVGYFEVQGEVNNVAPEAWFSEGDDDVAGITIGADSVEFAASAGSVGLNKIVDIPLVADPGLAIDASGTARYSLALTNEGKVDYMRMTATEAVVDVDTTWIATGYWYDGSRTPLTEALTLADWAEEAFLDGALIHQIGARHFTGEGAGSVKSITADGTKYVFGATAFDQADVNAALAAVPAGYVAKAELDAANKRIAELEGQLAADTKALTDAKDKAEAAAAKSANQALAAQARAPYRITGKAKAGNTLRVKGKSYKGVNVKYQWFVGGKKAGKKATVKLKKADAGKKVRVVVTKSFERANGKKATVKQNVKLTKVNRVAR